MALALNNYNTITGVVGTNAVGIYTAPTGYSAIVLLAQATNIGSDTQTINFSHERTTSGIAVTTEILLGSRQERRRNKDMRLRECVQL